MTEEVLTFDLTRLEVLYQVSWEPLTYACRTFLTLCTTSYVVWLGFEVGFVYFLFPETAHRTLEELAFCTCYHESPYVFQIADCPFSHSVRRRSARRTDETSRGRDKARRTFTRSRESRRLVACRACGMILWLASHYAHDFLASETYESYQCVIYYICGVHNICPATVMRMGLMSRNETGRMFSIAKKFAELQAVEMPPLAT